MRNAANKKIEYSHVWLKIIIYFCTMKIIETSFCIFAITGLLLASCGKRHAAATWDRIDSLTYKEPRVALAQLDSISKQYGDMGKEQQMRYLLLREKAKFKDYQPISGDTIIEELASYYDHKGNNRLKLDAQYLLGNYYAQRHDAPMAVTSFLNAIDFADTIENTRSLMLIHGKLQDLYENLFLKEEALKEMQQAVHYAMKCKDTAAALIYQEGKLWWYHNECKYDSAEMAANDLYQKWIEWKGSKGNTNSLMLSYCIKAELKKKNWGEAKRYLDIYQNSFADDNYYSKGLDWVLYNFYAEYYIGIGKLDSAFYYQHKLEQANSSYVGRMKLHYNYLEIYRKAGNADSIYKYSKLYNAYNDSTLINQNVERVAQIRGMYDYSKLLKENYIQRMEKERLQKKMIGGVLFVLLVIGGLVYAVWHIRRKEHEWLRQQNEKYDNLIDEYQAIARQRDMLKLRDSEQQQMYLEQQKKIEELSQQMTDMHPSKIKSPDAVLNNPQVLKLRHVAADGKCLNQSDWEALREELTTLDSRFADWLAAREGEIKERDQKLCVLTRLGFIPTEMAMLLATSRSNITNIRSRLMIKLFGEEGSATDFDRRIANI